MDHPYLSFCMTTYNRAYEIEKNIEQILAYPGNDIEVIVVDDNSQDGTKDILSKISDSRFRYYRNEKNEGGPQSWFRSLEYGNGEFLYCLNDYDTVYTASIEKIISILRSESYRPDVPIGLAYVGRKTEGNDELIFLNKGWETYRYFAYRCFHPSEVIFSRKAYRACAKRQEYFCSPIFYKRLYAHGYVVADFASEYRSIIIDYVNLWSDNSQRTSSSHAYDKVKSSTPKYWEPEAGYEIIKNNIEHLVTLNAPNDIKVKLFEEVFATISERITYHYRMMCNMSGYLNRYGMKSRSISTYDFLRIDLKLRRKVIQVVKTSGFNEVYAQYKDFIRSFLAHKYENEAKRALENNPTMMRKIIWGIYVVAVRLLGHQGKIANLLRRIKRGVFRKSPKKIATSTANEPVIMEAPNMAKDNQWHTEVFARLPNGTPDISCLDIAFLVPRPIKGGGGHRNIYRAVRFLSEYGHTVTVYHSGCSDEVGSITKKHVSDWFYPMRDNIRFLTYDGNIGYHDVCIACWWELAHELKRQSDKVLYPFYFVQDYDAAFYPMSASALMCENSYKLGFSHICSGRWCKEFLINKYHAEAEYFTFPVDHKTYNIKIPRIKKNTNIVFFAKPEMPRRCYELGIRALALVKEKRPDIEIILYGSNEVSWIPCEVTMKGILPTIFDLANLYRNADLGMVFSTTNPSLVPYEMMLCECPVVDVNMDGALMKYGNDINNVFLFDTRPEVMAEQIIEIIDDKELLHQKATAGRNWVMNTFPTEEQMGRIVEGYILNKVQFGKMSGI